MQHFPFLWPCHKQQPLPLSGLQQCPRCHLPHTGTPRADQSHAKANQQHPQETSGSGGGVGTGSQTSQEKGFPPTAMALLLSGTGWLGKPSPILAGIIPAQERHQRQTPLLAPLFRQSVGRGRQGARLTTRFQTGSAGTVPGLLNAPLLPRGTGHPPAATPTAGPWPPLLASPWHSWGDSRAQWRTSRNIGGRAAAPVLRIRNQQLLWPSPPQGSGNLPRPATGCLAQGK